MPLQCVSSFSVNLTRDITCGCVSVSAIISVGFVYTGALNYLDGNHCAEKWLILKCWHENIYTNLPINITNTIQYQYSICTTASSVMLLDIISS